MISIQLHTRLERAEDCRSIWVGGRLGLLGLVPQPSILFTKGICAVLPNSPPREISVSWLTGETGSFNFPELPADAYPLTTHPSPSSLGLHQPAGCEGSTGRAGLGWQRAQVTLGTLKKERQSMKN